MTSFSLLKFKFTQIFLIGQNGFSKMINFLKNRPIIRSNRPNFGFQNFFNSSRGSTSFWQIFFSFHWIFMNFWKYYEFTSVRIITLHRILKHWSHAWARERQRRIMAWATTYVRCRGLRRSKCNRWISLHETQEI
jgi:hypothetical protein